MNITADHWLEEATREPIEGGAPMPVRRALVIHFTSGASARSSIEFWRTPAAKGASAHLVIDRDGTLYQCRPFDRTCGHAGVSRWADPKSGQRHLGLNACSIGIELANAGNDAAVLRIAARLPGYAGTVHARHANEPRGAGCAWEVYPAAQLQACFAAAQALVHRYRLDDVTGHDCIAPERKNDPGPAFPMAELRVHCGFAGLPIVHRA
jgi:N-acetyl-anhydromuramyl-L-alanine amidase AmpD